MGVEDMLIDNRQIKNKNDEDPFWDDFNDKYINIINLFHKESDINQQLQDKEYGWFATYLTQRHALPVR